MKHILKIRVITAALTLAMCMGLLCGCGNHGFDAVAYVKGGLDALYLGEVSDEYLELVVDSREDCLAMYEENMLNEARNFGKMFYVDVNNEPEEALVQLYKDIFARSKYEVGEATEENGGYTVEVTVYPIDLFRTSYEALDMYDREFTQRFADGEFEGIAGSDIEKDYLQGMIDILRSGLEGCGYLDAVSVTLHLTDDGDGVYTITDDDYAELHKNIIAY